MIVFPNKSCCYPWSYDQPVHHSSFRTNCIALQGPDLSHNNEPVRSGRGVPDGKVFPDTGLFMNQTLDSKDCFKAKQMA